METLHEIRAIEFFLMHASRNVNRKAAPQTSQGTNLIQLQQQLRESLELNSTPMI